MSSDTDPTLDQAQTVLRHLARLNNAQWCAVIASSANDRAASIDKGSNTITPRMITLSQICIMARGVQSTL